MAEMKVVQIEQLNKGDVVACTTGSGSVYTLTVVDPRRCKVRLVCGRHVGPQTCFVYWGRIEVGARLTLQNLTRQRDMMTSAVSRIEVRTAA